MAIEVSDSSRGTGRRYNSSTQTGKEAGKDRDKAVIEVSKFNFLKVGIEYEMYVCVEDWW